MSRTVLIVGLGVAASLSLATRGSAANLIVSAADSKFVPVKGTKIYPPNPPPDRPTVIDAFVAPQTLPDCNPNAGGIKAYYFEDPDGNVLEILRFPSDKGDPRWQRAADGTIGVMQRKETVTQIDKK